MENIKACEVCKKEYTYSEYEPYNDGNLKEIIKKSDSLSKLNIEYQKRTFTCDCGTYPEAKLIVKGINNG